MLLRYKMKQINSPEARDDLRGIAHFLPSVYADIHSLIIARIILM